MENSILFYDGVCGFCNQSVQLVLKWSKNKKLLFATLQGKKAEEFKNKFQNFPKDLKYIVYFHQNKLYFGAQGFFEIARDFKYPYKIFSLFRYLPNFMSDFFYNLIALNRYKIFGKVEACFLPPYEDRVRFVD